MRVVRLPSTTRWFSEVGDKKFSFYVLTYVYIVRPWQYVPDSTFVSFEKKNDFNGKTRGRLRNNFESSYCEWPICSIVSIAEKFERERHCWVFAETLASLFFFSFSYVFLFFVFFFFFLVFFPPEFRGITVIAFFGAIAELNDYHWYKS